MQRRRHPDKSGLQPLASTWFQVLFHSAAVLFTFPSQYLFAIGLSIVFSLTGWCRWIPTGRLRPRSTQDTARYLIEFMYRIITFYDAAFQTASIFD